MIKIKYLLNRNSFMFEKFEESTQINDENYENIKLNWHISNKRIKAYARFPEILLNHYKTRLLRRKAKKRHLNIKTLAELLSQNNLNMTNPHFTLDLYPVFLNSKIKSKIFHYYPKNHSLEWLIFINLDEIYDFIIKYKIPQKSFYLFISLRLMVPANKNSTIYYKQALIEAGEVIDQIKSICDVLGLTTIKIPFFCNKYLDKLFEFERNKEFFIAILAIK